MKRLGIFIISLILVALVFEIYIKTISPSQSRYFIQGITLPHHALAKEILNDSFARLKKNISPKVVVIYGTNHYFPISPTFTTTLEVKNEYNLENVLADDVRIKGDHSIQTILPYVRQYFPNAKVIPIIVSTQYQGLSDLNINVQNFIQAFGGQKTLYIASVDFSHDSNLIQGLTKNNESIKSISSFNYKEVVGYGNDHMDSSLAITTLMLTMQNLGAQNWQTWYSSHGALITDQTNLEGTSYVIGIFSKKTN